MPAQSYSGPGGRRTDVLKLTESLVRQHTNSVLPIPLREIASARRIKEVRFAPMSKDGLLLPEVDGFTVCVKCDESSIAQWSDAWKNPMDSGRSLPGRTRFTIAHEIAHTFFYDLSNTEIRPFLDMTGSAISRYVEQKCNLAAGRMLLPDYLLHAEVKGNRDEPSVDLYDPWILSSLRRRAAVSPDCLLVRIDQSTGWKQKVGVIANVRRFHGKAVIQKLLVHPTLQQTFKNLSEGCAAEELYHHPDLAMYGGRESRIDTTLVIHTGRSGIARSVCVRCQPMYRHHTNWFLTVRTGIPISDDSCGSGEMAWTSRERARSTGAK